MKRVISIIIAIFVCSNFLFAQKTRFADTTEANNAGRYHTKDLLKEKQWKYREYKIITIKKGEIKVNGQKNKSEWFMISADLSEYGKKINQGFKKDSSAGFEYDTVKAKDGFDTEYTLYKKQDSEWNTQLGKSGWKVRKSDAGNDCVEIKVKKADGSEYTLYGKLDEIAETKDLILQGYLSKFKKESGQEYSETTTVVKGVEVKLYKKKVEESKQESDTSTKDVTTPANSSKKANKKGESTKDEPLTENNENAAADTLTEEQTVPNEATYEQLGDEQKQEIAPTDAKCGDQLKAIAEGQDKLLDTIKSIVIVVVVVLIALALLFLFFKKKKSNTVETTVNNQPQPQSAPVNPTPTITPAPAPVPTPKPKPMPAVPTDNIAFAKDADEWIVVGASVTGNGHIATKTPCQDSHKYEYLGEGWGIAVVSDGAGSAANSHIGSKIVAERAVEHFKNLIIGRNWIKKNELPTETEWSQIAFATLKAVHNDMEQFAKAKTLELKSLYATAIVVIHTPEGILATHIGDGRAGYRNQQGEWKALITPHKGEEANQTIFVPSDFWDIPAYKMSGVLVPESVVVNEKPFAFMLMSDGCENTSWLYNQQDETTGKFFDPNKPYPNFFNPLDETLQSFRKDKVDEKERAEKWKKFIESGNNSFVKEQDDKTMILGVVYM